MSTENDCEKHEDKALSQIAVIWRKFLPFIPIIGIPLTIIFHQVYGDTGIENNTINWITAFIQAFSIVIFVYAL
jgi:hypothetical protein